MMEYPLERKDDHLFCRYLYCRVNGTVNRTGVVLDTNLDTVSTFRCCHTVKYEMGIFSVYAKTIFKNVIKSDKRKRKPLVK